MVGQPEKVVVAESRASVLECGDAAERSHRFGLRRATAEHVGAHAGKRRFRRLHHRTPMEAQSSPEPHEFVDVIVNESFASLFF